MSKKVRANKITTIFFMNFIHDSSIKAVIDFSFTEFYFWAYVPKSLFVLHELQLLISEESHRVIFI